MMRLLACEPIEVARQFIEHADIEVLILARCLIDIVRREVIAKEIELGLEAGHRLRRDRFSELREWLDDVEAFWGDELSAFKAHAEKTRGGRRR